MLELKQKEHPQSLLEVKLNLISLLRYFTMWIIILDILYVLQIIPGIEFFLFWTHICIIFIFFQNFYFKAKEFDTEIYSYKIKIKGNNLILFDILFHYVPLILLCYYFQRNNIQIKFNTKSMFMLVFLPVLYCLLFDINKLYGFDKKQVLDYYGLFMLIVIIIFF